MRHKVNFCMLGDVPEYFEGCTVQVTIPYTPAPLTVNVTVPADYTRLYDALEYALDWVWEEFPDLQDITDELTYDQCELVAMYERE